MSNGFTCQRRVEFRDTDAAGIAHFSVFFVWMEQAEHEAMRYVGMSVMERDAEISWPRVSAQCDYTSPAFFEEVVDVRVTVNRLGRKSVTYGFDFHCAGRAIARGQITTVCCDITTVGQLKAIPIPPSMADQLRKLSA